MPDNGEMLRTWELITHQARDTKMCKKRTAREMLKRAMALSATGMLLAMSCSSTGLQALSDGLDAVAGSLAAADRDRVEDITFGEWLLSELN